jgi:hypothetical protein
MGWVVTASGAIAGRPAVATVIAPRCEASPQPSMERPEVVDGATGARLKLTRKGNGAIQASLAWQELDVRKVIQPNGDFVVRLSGRQDLVVLVRTGSRLRASRNGASAVLALDQADEDGLDAVQQVMAGSRAMRMFRSLRGHLAADSLASAPGVAIDLVDALVGILQGDPSVLDRREPARNGRLSRASFRGGASCFSEYETEVVAAWGDFGQCIDDVSWFPGMQEACAFVWLLRVESAWFRFIGCSSIPLKAD